MAKINTIKTINEEKMVVTLEMGQEEFLNLQGNIDDVHLIPEKTISEKSRLISRGRADATKYFIVPRNFREGLNSNSKVVCRRIEAKGGPLLVFKLVDD